MSIFVALLIIFVVGWAAIWFANETLPDPFRMIAKVVIGVICIFALLVKAGLISGAGLGV